MESGEFFHASQLTHQERVFRLDLPELQGLESQGSYWHAAGDPSTWLAVDCFRFAQAKHPDLPQDQALLLTAQALGCSVDKLRELIEWHENYMRWHDGDWSYRIL